jgi:hypothetical protein
MKQAIEQASLFDEPPQKESARHAVRAAAESNAPAPHSTAPAPLETPDEAERNRRAHATFSDYIAGRW